MWGEWKSEDHTENSEAGYWPGLSFSTLFLPYQAACDSEEQKQQENETKRAK